MDRYIAFLRGMNLGNRRLKNEEPCSHFEALGCEDVATFRASGNVVFAKGGKRGESELDWRAVEVALGPTTVRTKGTIDQIAAKHLGP